MFFFKSILFVLVFKSFRDRDVRVFLKVVDFDGRLGGDFEYSSILENSFDNMCIRDSVEEDMVV